MKNLKTIFFVAWVAAFWVGCGSNEAETEPPKEIPQYSIEQFMDNTRVAGGSFSPDESKILIGSNESGIFNLYEIEIKSGKKTQLTHSEEESFFPISYVPSTGEVLYSADQGGNELNHIYLLQDSSSLDLTPGEREKASVMGWNEDYSILFFQSNRRDPRFFDLYKMRVGEWQPEMIYQNDKGYNLSGVSYDGSYLALVEAVTTSESKLFLYNLQTEEMQEVSNPDEPGAYSSSNFSRDSKTFYYTHNAGDREFTVLNSFDPATGSHATVYEDNWDVMYSYLSRKGTYRVIAVNADGKNKLVIKRTADGSDVKFPDIEGDVVAALISNSEKLMRLTIGTSRSPNNIYVYNLETEELKQLTNTQNDEIAEGSLASAEVVRYKSFDGLEIPGIFYKPLNASKDHKVPALVWVHGGPGGQTRVGYSPLIQYLVNHGYAILGVNNRGSSGYGKTFYKMDDRNHGEKDLQDCVYSKKFLAELDYIDGDRIGIIGGSYGGYMTMAAMTFEPEEFEVGVNIFGVTNWLRTLKSIPPYWESFRAALYEEMGDPYTEDSVRLHNISPLFHAEQVKNPIMVLQGANDPRVLQVESDEIVEAVKANQVPVEYVLFPDEGHGFVKKENEIKGYEAILSFLDQYLKGEKKDGA